MKRGKHDDSVVAPPMESPVAMAGNNSYVGISIRWYFVVMIFSFHISHICLRRNGKEAMPQFEVLSLIKSADAFVRFSLSEFLNHHYQNQDG